MVNTALNGYKSTNDKIAFLEHSGFVIRLKRGVFIVSPKVHHKPLSKELIANHLYGTSYILTSFYPCFIRRMPFFTPCFITNKWYL